MSKYIIGLPEDAILLRVAAMYRLGNKYPYETAVNYTQAESLEEKIARHRAQYNDCTSAYYLGRVDAYDDILEMLSAE